MTINKRINSLLQSSFIRNVGVLVGGTAFSQIIALLALPFLTRLYTPQDFTILATYTSVLALLTVISCLRFEIAIPMPESQKDAFNLLALSGISVIGITLLTLIAVIVYEKWINEITAYRLDGYLWLLPAGVFFSGMYNSLQYWMTREKKFSLVARTRMTQSVSGATVQLGCGYVGITPFGLLLGQLLNVGAGVWGLLYRFCKENVKKTSLPDLKVLIKTFREYNRFPKYSTLEALTNSAGVQVPVLIIASLVAGAEAGFLMLAMRLLSAPMGLIGGSVAQVYLAEASDRYHQGKLEEFTNKTILMLAKSGVGPFALAGIAAPFVVPIVFGDEWRRAGILIAWMIPWFFMQFITSPVSMSLHITGNQKIALLLQVAGLFIRGGFVWLAAIQYNSFVGEVYAVTGLIFYIIYLMIVKSIIYNIDKNK